MTKSLIADAKDINGDPDEVGLPTNLDEAIDYAFDNGIRWQVEEKDVYPIGRSS